MITLLPKELERYGRQILIFGEKRQERLKNARVAILGLGGLGSAIAYYLAAAGVGTLRIIDGDRVELDNLNRQILHWTTDIGKPKTESAREKLVKLNPEIEIEPVHGRITRDNVSKLIGDVDIIVDALDNFETRYIADEYAHEIDIPLVHGAVEAFYGQATTIIPGKTYSLREIFPNMTGSKGRDKPIPVIGVTPGIIGLIEATETIKIILGMGTLLENKLLLVDLLNNRFEIIQLK
ncbi:MAG: HesA/MoeB/ThiF family protein [Euryarchaeota archaeon]|nr:HesA/MoeB/ThiF family protein [Euryarchaeota archaeon]